MDGYGDLLSPLPNNHHITVKGFGFHLRSAINKALLKKNGIKVLSACEQITDSPEGIILEAMIEGYAEYYSAELSQKVKRGMRESCLKGNAAGVKPIFGYCIVDKNIKL